MHPNATVRQLSSDTVVLYRRGQDKERHLEKGRRRETEVDIHRRITDIGRERQTSFQIVLIIRY